MESCGVTYTLTKLFDADFRNKKDKFQPFNPHNQQSSSMMKLDPDFEQLLDYPLCEELALRHRVVSQEMRQLLHTEQRKYSIQLKVMLFCVEFSKK